MAGRRKLIKKKLKEPDEFISVTEHAMRFILRHYKAILVGGAILGLLAVAFFLFRHWEERKEREAEDLFRKALETYSRVESPYQEGSPSDPKRLVDAFSEIIGRFPRTSAGTLSLLYKGNLHLKAGQFDEALKAYETFLQKAGKERIYRLVALEGLGYAHEGRKDYEKALEVYEQMLNLAEGPDVASAHLGKARCYEKLGKTNEALGSYQAFLQAAPRSVMANLVLRRISELGH